MAFEPQSADFRLGPSRVHPNSAVFRPRAGKASLWGEIPAEGHAKMDSAKSAPLFYRVLNVPAAKGRFTYQIIGTIDAHLLFTQHVGQSRFLFLEPIVLRLGFIRLYF